MNWESQKAQAMPVWRAWRKPPQWMIWLLWLALPLSALEYRQNWDHLPARMATHFDANWQPNGYTTRDGAFDTGLGIMAALLLLFTVLVFVARALNPVMSWAMLLVFYVATGFVWYGNHSLIKFNLNPPPAHSELVGPHSPALRDSRRDVATYVPTERFS